jgi:microcin C transport system substrate-binding protein
MKRFERTSMARTPLACLFALAVLCLGASQAFAQADDTPPRPPAVPLEAVEAQPLDSQPIYRAHAIAMHGRPKYDGEFEHFDYINPDAPKGGRLRLGAEGTFDTFNPWNGKGNPISPGGQSLMVGSDDEAFTMYCLVCDEIIWPEDRSWVEFTMNPDARWHDGEPITVDDVIFSFNTLREEGAPFYRYYYGGAGEAVKVAEDRVRFNFADEGNRELPLIIGQMALIPKHYWEDRDFTATTLEPPLTSGPYRISDFEPGRFYVQARVEDYWGADHPTEVGQNNFDEIRTDYYFDTTAIRQALKAEEIDYRIETQAKAWALDYEIAAVEDGWLNKVVVPDSIPAGMQGFFMNTRRPLFKDAGVRRALAYAFDFEWTNRNLFFGQYERTESYFANSEMASSGLPEGRELEILEDYRGRVPEEVFTTPYAVPTTNGEGWPRDNLIAAMDILNEAGWELRDFKLVNQETGRPFEFEILLVSQAFERIVLPFVRNLSRLGIEARVRLVDQSQYINRVREFDFDMIVFSARQSDSPGNEQRTYFSSEAADQPNSRNVAGIKDPVVDELIERIIRAHSREELVATVRAMDRILLWGHYVVPQWYFGGSRILYWDKFSQPPEPTRHGTSYNWWWFDEEKAAALEERAPVEPQAEPSAEDSGPNWVLWAGIAFFAILVLWINRKPKQRLAGGRS